VAVAAVVLIVAVTCRRRAPWRVLVVIAYQSGPIRAGNPGP
jgi:hypothetical protein